MRQGVGLEQVRSQRGQHLADHRFAGGNSAR